MPGPDSELTRARFIGIGILFLAGAANRKQVGRALSDGPAADVVPRQHRHLAGA
jgi:hypothetical protein